MKQKRQNFVGKIIAFLLIVQTVLISVQGKIHIERGDYPVEVLMWMINQYIWVLKQARGLENKEKEDKEEN